MLNAFKCQILAIFSDNLMIFISIVIHLYLKTIKHNRKIKTCFVYHFSTKSSFAAPFLCGAVFFVRSFSELLRNASADAIRLASCSASSF